MEWRRFKKMPRVLLVTEEDDGTSTTVPYEENAWQSEVTTLLTENNRNLSELSSLLRSQSEASSTLVPSLLEANTRLTAQLQEMPRQVVELVTPLLTPPLLPPTIAVIETLHTDEPPLDESEEDPSEAVLETTEVIPEPVPVDEKTARRFKRF
jgi:hypothetical protein